MIDADKDAINTLLKQKGVLFNELSARDNVLVIGITGELDIESLMYVANVVYALGLKGAWLKHKTGLLWVG